MTRRTTCAVFALLLSLGVLAGLSGCRNACEDLKQTLKVRLCDPLPEAQRAPCEEGLKAYESLPTEACADHLAGLDGKKP